MDAEIFVGTAGWGISKRHDAFFPAEGSHLARYAAVLRAVEINSSFYKPHRRETYERWAASVPAGFRFSVKLPKAMTHERRLADCEGALDVFLDQAGGLAEKLGVLLVQLPPSLPFASDIAGAFFAALRRRSDAGIACEPRHASWFVPEAQDMLASFRVARVAADPPPHPQSGTPGGWPRLSYMRLHGSPRIYFSDYAPEALNAVAQRLAATRKAGSQAWCIFDNTTEGHALGNAVSLHASLQANR